MSEAAGSLAEREAPAARSSHTKSAAAGSLAPVLLRLTESRTSSRPSWSWSDESTVKLRVSSTAALAARTVSKSGCSTFGETTSNARDGARAISGGVQLAVTSSVALCEPV